MPDAEAARPEPAPKTDAAVDHAAYQTEIHACNVAKGWYDKPVSFIEATGLLMTEVIEANDARQDLPQMASEFADCYIRLADYCFRFGLNLASVLSAYRRRNVDGYGADQLSVHLIRCLRDAIEAYRSHGLQSIGAGDFIAGPEIAAALANFYYQLEYTCELYGIDLMKAVDAKILVNWKREYRHGGKHA